MGATNWKDCTPYQDDANSALQTLRELVAAQGNYVHPPESIDDFLLPTVRRLGRHSDNPDQQWQIDKEVEVHRAVVSGDMTGLSPAIGAFAIKMQALRQSAGGAKPTALKLQPRPKSRSSSQILKAASASGTHSILDIERAGKRPGFGIASPLPVDQMHRVFGSAEPNREDVEQRWQEIGEGLGRWQARYFVVFGDGQPLDYAFIGCSGD